MPQRRVEFVLPALKRFPSRIVGEVEWEERKSVWGMPEAESDLPRDLYALGGPGIPFSLSLAVELGEDHCL